MPRARLEVSLIDVPIFKCKLTLTVEFPLQECTLVEGATGCHLTLALDVSSVESALVDVSACICHLTLAVPFPLDIWSLVDIPIFLVHHTLTVLFTAREITDISATTDEGKGALSMGLPGGEFTLVYVP